MDLTFCFLTTTLAKSSPTKTTCDIVQSSAIMRTVHVIFNLRHAIQFSGHDTRTTDCRLGIKDGLGIKHGLQTVDWV